MATIEPRLMHLLNDSKAHDLPSIQLLPFGGPGTHSVSLPPLDPDASQKGEKSAPKQLLPFYPVSGDSRYSLGHQGSFGKDSASFGAKPAHPLQSLLGDSDTNAPLISLRMILDDVHVATEDSATKKRHRALTVKEDFVQLPQPLKKQKSTQQVMPPIINGLVEPPPNAAVFPPMSSASFDDSDATNLGALKEFTPEDRAPPLHPGLILSDADRNVACGNIGVKAKRRAAKPRRKWTEEETKNLLLGVSRHGVGKWTSILEDEDFFFDDRTAGDLKDRFRTCCPDELRGQAGRKHGVKDKEKESYVVAVAPKRKAKPKVRSPLTNVPVDADKAFDPDGLSPSRQHEDESCTKPRKSRAHRKKMEDLVELGISAPFKKSHRRERRPFTEQDDREILEGLDQYGPAWTKIQRDPRFNLSTRQPTDLRDRVRNKYPEIYTRIEKGNFQINDGSRGNNLLEPSVNTTIEQSLNPTKTGPLEHTLNRIGSRDELSRWQLTSSLLEPTEQLPGIESCDTIEPATAILLGSVGEMDISRLLLDDSQIDIRSASNKQATQFG